MKCAVCGKEPHEIEEYVGMAAEEGMLPSRYVECEEGTYNSKTDTFYCTRCYIDIGMPLGKAK